MSDAIKVLISADMEGISGVVHPDDVTPGTPGWEEFRVFMTSDVNAAVTGFFEGGAHEVLVNDAHWSMRNLRLDLLDPRAQIIRGRHKLLGMMEGLDDTTSAVAFVGYHAGAGEFGVLSHCFMAHEITRLTLNGVSASEGMLNARLARELSVPVVLVTGDDQVGADAARYSPDATVATVKFALDRYAARCLPIFEAQELIRQKARQGLIERKVPIPHTGPVTLTVEFYASHLAAWVARLPFVEQVDLRTVTFTSTTMRQAYLSFRAITSLAVGSVEPHFG